MSIKTFKSFQEKCPYNICSGRCGYYDFLCEEPCEMFKYYQETYELPNGMKL